MKCNNAYYIVITFWFVSSVGLSDQSAVPCMKKVKNASLLQLLKYVLKYNIHQYGMLNMEIILINFYTAWLGFAWIM